jgi:hypothetical protein
MRVDRRRAQISKAEARRRAQEEHDRITEQLKEYPDDCVVCGQHLSSPHPDDPPICSQSCWADFREGAEEVHERL